MARFTPQDSLLAIDTPEEMDEFRVVPTLRGYHPAMITGRVSMGNNWTGKVTP